MIVVFIRAEEKFIDICQHIISLIIVLERLSRYLINLSINSFYLVAHSSLIGLTIKRFYDSPIQH